MWVSLGDNILSTTRHNTSISIFHFFRSKTPMLLPKAGNITAQSRDHVAQFPLLCLTWLNSTMWWKWKWYVQLLEAVLKREGVSFRSFYPFCWPKRTHEEWSWIRHCGIWQRRCIMGMTGSWETASQWIVSYHIDPMSLMQAAGWGAELTSIFLASVIRRVGCSIKPAPIKYTGCKDAANPKYRKRDKWKGNEKRGFEISPGFGQL